MPLEIIRQANFTAGQLDAKLLGRRDLKFYSAGLALGRNVLVRPQGEIVRRPGMAMVSTVRTTLAAVDISGAAFTYTHGYNTAPGLIVDDDTWFKTVDHLAAVDPYVIADIDLGAPKAVGLVYLKDYIAQLVGAPTPTPATADYPWTSATTALASVPGALKVQWYDGADWQDFGQAMDLGTLLRTRLISSPPGQPVTSQRWRLVKVGATDFGALVFWAQYLEFLAETGDESVTNRIWRFTFDSADQQFEVVATDGVAEVFQRGGRVATFRLPYDGDQLLTVRRAQSLDTLLTFHPDVQTHRITRQGSADQWDTRPAVFDHVPLFDYDGTDAGSVNEQQDINFKDYHSGDTFTLFYEGEETTTLTYVTPAGAPQAATIQAALEALASVGAGNIVVTYLSDNLYQVEFVEELGGDAVSPLSGLTASSASGIVYCTIARRGQEGGEAIFSDARGWPRSGCFYQGRLYLGGIKLRPQTILASRLGEYFNFNVKGAKSDAAIFITIDTDTVTEIQTLFPGRNLQVFTNAAEFYFPTEPIIPPAPAIKQATRRGLRTGTPVFDIDGATTFVIGAGTAIASFAFSFNDENYTADPMTVQSSDLVNGVLDMGYRKAKSTTDPDLVLNVRDDGGAAFMSAMLTQDVLGFYDVITDGEFLASTGDANGDLYALVRRHHDGGSIVCLERFDESRMLDSSAYAEGEVTRLPLPHLIGREVMLYVDGALQGTTVVDEDGWANLIAPSARSAEAGLWFEPRGRLLPAVLEDPRGGGSLYARVGTIEFRLGPTANLKAGLAGGRMWTVPLNRTALLDAGDGENLYEGWARLTGVAGFANDAQVEFTQDAPGPFAIREIVATIGT